QLWAPSPHLLRKKNQKEFLNKPASLRAAPPNGPFGAAPRCGHPPVLSIRSSPLKGEIMLKLRNKPRGSAVSPTALVKRINRKLHALNEYGEVLKRCRARNMRAFLDYGDYYLLDVSTGALLQPDV